ncbi:uncharacterized protein E0L32_005770 [Thyridium curvatum]|uniref:Phosphatidate phosphatase APP1 catalytic domain-containing protein n=1 Tax=Thyridium curvatum TaxID=1093900 RepID=A0A507B429_9PEZI|nr:uncharacterized protein E0L32_005770 [Thyridium curvatum]TPX13826.1 hypothetical protein E0L32_005770 [Thyridium curvatum]
MQLESVQSLDLLATIGDKHKLAPLKRPGRSHFRHTLLRYLFPPAVRDRYRERLLNFHLDTVPRLKHGLQSRIYRLVLSRQQKRRDRSRIIDIVSRKTGRLLLGPAPPPPPPPSRASSLRRHAHNRQGKDVKLEAQGSSREMQPSSSSQWGAYGSQGNGAPPGAYGPDVGGREPGTRRRKIAAMAGNVYRAGVAAASEIREQYSNTRFRGLDTSDEKMTIPGSFPDVAIVTHGDEQMVLFPSYAKRHVRQFDDNGEPLVRSAVDADMNEEQYWRQEWQKMEDKKAIVDVDVRGWIYSPHKGPMTRKNRMLIGLARRLSGIPPPTMQTDEEHHMTPHEEREELREQQRIANEAEAIEKKGQGEKEIGTRGGYSEEPRDDDDDAASLAPPRKGSGHESFGSAPPSPTLSARTSWNSAADLTKAELAVANANLMARLGPFLTTPLIQLPITLFFYNDETSQSRTVMTNDAGHFEMRAALDFVPTHVRVLANEGLSATEPVSIIESQGISLISDIDDTVKRSNISLGAREIFRNTFIRDLGDMSVDGISEWYNSLHEMGVQFHYCSNSPWQLFPVLATFFKGAQLPPGSLHLRAYSGMLQGIFEPVAERKRGTLDKILKDFPERKFLLVGDSGEADLEVYTELAQSHPGRVLAVFIRDVTTPEQAGYFDAGIDPSILRRKATAAAPVASNGNGRNDDTEQRPALPPRVRSEPPPPEGPVMGDLIDFSDEPPAMDQNGAKELHELKQEAKAGREPSALDLLSRKAPPPRPKKPMALRGAPSDVPAAQPNSDVQGPAPPDPRQQRVRAGLPLGAVQPRAHAAAQTPRRDEPLLLPGVVHVGKGPSAAASPPRHADGQPEPEPARGACFLLGGGASAAGQARHGGQPGLAGAAAPFRFRGGDAQRGPAAAAGGGDDGEQEGRDLAAEAGAGARGAGPAGGRAVHVAPRGRRGARGGGDRQGGYEGTAGAGARFSGSWVGVVGSLEQALMVEAVGRLSHVSAFDPFCYTHDKNTTNGSE